MESKIVIVVPIIYLQKYMIKTNITSCYYLMLFIYKLCVAAKPCHRLPQIKDGEIICSSIHVGSNCTYHCDVGYQLHGDGVRTCMLGQVWSGDGTSCKRMLM